MFLIICLCLFSFAQLVESSYLPTTGSNIEIGTSTPVGGLTVMNGNVGIGTWSPTSELQVIGTVSATAYLGDGSGLSGIATGGGWLDGGTDVYLSTTADLVAIGTTTPAGALTVVGNVGIGTTVTYRNIAGPANGLIVEGNVGIGTWVAANGKLIVMGGNVGVGTVNPRGVLTVMSGNMGIGTWSPTDTLSIVGNIAVGTTTPYRAISGPVNGMAIEGNVGIGTWAATSGKLMIMDSNVGIGTTTPVAALAVMSGNVGIGTWSPTEKFHVRGNLRVQGSTDCILGNGAGATNCSSDIRLKDNVHEIENSLSKIISLHGVEFDWSEKSLSPGSHSIGMIAQEVQKVFPTAVVEDPDTGNKMLDYAVLVAPIIEAVKELNKQTTGLYNGFSEMIAQNAAKAAEIILLKAEADRNVQEVRRLKEESALKEKELGAIKAWICRKDSDIPFCRQEGAL